KGNVINPDEFVQEYGADAVRIYLAFIGPYNEPGNYPWSLEGVKSMRKFLERIVRVVERARDTTVLPELQKVIQKTNRKVAKDAERFKFNTAIAALMIALNELETHADVPLSITRDYIIL